MFGELVFLLLILFVLWAYSKQKKPFKRVKYGKESITMQDEKVRSNAERIIADYFTKNNIRYEYEREVRGRKMRTVHPDFYLPDYNIYVEYWGLVDADDEKVKTQYIRNMKRKMAQYHNNGIKFISIYPRNLEYLDWIFRKKFQNVTGLQLRARARVFKN